MNWPEAVIFDFDGLLVDSAECWNHAYHDIAARHDQALDETVLAELAGASVQAAAVRTGLPISDLRESLFRAFEAGSPTWFPGARELIRTLDGQVKLAVATNAPSDLVKEVLRASGVNGSFEAIVSGEEQVNAKPAPDVYIAACHALGVHPAQAIAFEDSSTGILAAQRAGLPVVQVSPTGGPQPGILMHVARLDDPRVSRLLGLRGMD